jgi:hypothetical protein
VTAAFARAFNDEMAKQSLAQRMRGRFRHDGTRGVSVNLFKTSDPLHAKAEDFPKLDGVWIIAGHADPSQAAMTDHRVSPEGRYEGENAANDLIRAGIGDGDDVLVLGCGSGVSGFINSVYNALALRGINASVTGPAGLTTFGTARQGNVTYTYFPAFENNASKGPESRVHWATVGEN